MKSVKSAFYKNRWTGHGPGAAQLAAKKAAFVVVGGFCTPTHSVPLRPVETFWSNIRVDYQLALYAHFSQNRKQFEIHWTGQKQQQMFSFVVSLYVSQHVLSIFSVEGFGNFPLLASGRAKFTTWGSNRNATLENSINISVRSLQQIFLFVLQSLSNTYGRLADVLWQL